MTCNCHNPTRDCARCGSGVLTEKVVNDALQEMCEDVKVHECMEHHEHDWGLLSGGGAVCVARFACTRELTKEEVRQRVRQRVNGVFARVK
jgi:galactitol-specific phosphotransferase system IIB component